MHIWEKSNLVIIGQVVAPLEVEPDLRRGHPPNPVLLYVFKEFNLEGLGFFILKVKVVFQEIVTITEFVCWKCAQSSRKFHKFLEFLVILVFVPHVPFVYFNPERFGEVEEAAEDGDVLQGVVDGLVDVDLEVGDDLLHVEADVGVLQGLENEREEDLGAHLVCVILNCLNMRTLTCTNNKF